MNSPSSNFANILGSLIGLVLAFFWTWVASQIYGYFAINRFADHWPMAVKTVAPGLLFVGLVVLPTLLVIPRMWAQAGRAIVWSSIIVYAVTEAATFVSFRMDSTAWLVLAMTIALIVLIGWLLQPVRLKSPSPRPD